MLNYRPYTYATLLFVICIIGICIGYLQNPLVFVRKAYIDDFRLITGQICWVFISLNIIIAARPSFIEKLMPLDAWYKFHKILGIFAFVFTFIHFFGKDIAIFICNNFIAFPDPAPNYKLELLFQSFKGFAKDSAEYITYIALILFILCFISKVKYKPWYYSHKLFALLYLGLLVHVIVLTPDLKHSEPFTILVDIITILGAIAAIITLFNLTGYKKRQKAQVDSIETKDNITLLTLKTPKPYKAQLGQFFFIKYQGQNFHPFSAFNIEGDKISFLIKGFGDFTKNLGNKLKIGDTVTIEGPHGKFIPLAVQNDKEVLYVAQGIGIAPFAGCIKHLAKLPKLPFKLHLIVITVKGEDDPTIQYLKSDLMQLSKLGATITIHNRRAQGRFSEQNIKSLPLAKYDDVFFCGIEDLGKILKANYKAQGGRDYHQEYYKWR